MSNGNYHLCGTLRVACNAMDWLKVGTIDTEMVYFHSSFHFLRIMEACKVAQIKLCPHICLYHYWLLLLFHTIGVVITTSLAKRYVLYLNMYLLAFFKCHLYLKQKLLFTSACSYKINYLVFSNVKVYQASWWVYHCLTYTACNGKPRCAVPSPNRPCYLERHL